MQKNNDKTSIYKTIISSIKDIPPYPDVILKAKRLIKKDNSSIGELADLITNDPGLSGRILKLANSAFYNVKGRVGSIKYASQILGLKILCEIIETAALEPLLKKKLTTYEINAKDLWRHSLFVAYCAKTLCEKSIPDYAQDAFTAGLLHDTGKIILDPWLIKYKNKLNLIQDDKKILIKESAFLGINHAQIGYAITKLWNLPDHIQISIRDHHKSNFTKNEKLSSILYVANMMALVSLKNNSKSESLFSFNNISEKIDISIESMVNITAESLEFTENITGT